MSQMLDLTVPSTVPGRTLHLFRCIPDSEIRAVLQLSHGMVEFIDRYKPLAEYLAAQGILVTGHDHLGHGASIHTKEDYGYFAEPDGNRAVLEDLHSVTVLTKKLYPGLPYFLLGHSMGSFYARQYIAEYGYELTGAIIMGTGFQPKALVRFAKEVCRVMALFRGWHYRSSLISRLSFLGYNRGLEGRTSSDWLNRDQAEVDKYLADERCTFTFTLNAYYSMFTGILRLYDTDFIAQTPQRLPLLFLAGDADPVGEQGAAVKRAVKSLQDVGVENIQLKLYHGARHELLMETNRQEVFSDIAGWIAHWVPGVR
ncbi:MAG: alpha/beta fold hydrolase [Faecalibacterium sp.]